MSLEPCECPIAGWCNRHKLHMNRTRHSICQGNYGWSEERTEEYLANLQTRKSFTPEHPRPVKGTPGTELKKILSWFHTTGSCGCDDMAKKMDAWGPEGCERNMNEIITHLSNAARERLKIPIHPSVLKCLVRTAIRRSEKLAKV